MIETTQQPFGTLPSGQEIFLYTFRNSNGFTVSITNFGGRIVRVLTPDRRGRFADVVLGFDALNGYVAKNPYFGALIGRYANRIAGGRFTLDGHQYQLDLNSGESTLHGGKIGFDSVAWDTSVLDDGTHTGLVLEHTSPDGDEGFPGTLKVRVTYHVTEDNQIHIHFHATTDKKTVLNLTNHSYFNLSGIGGTQILDHVVTVHADRFVPANEHLVPTGELAIVAETPFDFRKPTAIGDRIDSEHEQLHLAEGYDHTYVLNGQGHRLFHAARALHPATGRTLDVDTTQPGVQFYTGNHLAGKVVGKGGVAYGFRTGLCFEAQHFPDSPNHPNFPSTVLEPNNVFDSTTIFRFGVASD